MKDKNINKVKKTKTITYKKNLCTRCNKREASEDYHSCPFDEDVNNDSSENCKCCDYCTNQCCADI